jgi:uncharacterized protein (DUF1501 family)
MKWTRRDFIRNSALAAAGVSLSNPLFAATKRALAPAANEKVVVVINLFGGNDGVNTVIPLSPVEYNQYRALRPVLGYDQAQILPLSGTPDFGLNPGLTEFQSLYNQGKLAVIGGVGVPDTAVGLFDHEAGQYEFQSCDIVRSGTIQPSGWLGRYLDTVPAGSVSPGIDLGGGRLLVTGLVQQPVSLYTIDDFQLQVSSWGSDETARRNAYSNIMNAGPIVDSPVAEQNRQYRVAALQQSTIIQQAVANYSPSVTYPDSWLGYQLRECARIIYGNVGVRALTVGTGGYDTHSGQDAGAGAGTLGYHASLLQDVAEAVAALYQDLVNQNLSNRVLILTISEFGRRVYQNTDDGTDHGFGSVAFAVGDMVNGGDIYGTYPSLQDQFLVMDGNLDVTTDFRSFYATVIDKYLGGDPDLILGDSFAELNFL